jgi:hypothetical protein
MFLTRCPRRARTPVLAQYRILRMHSNYEIDI